MTEQYEPVIGLEVHVQLRTRTKLFCSCAVTFGEEPNSRICPVCTGLPGVLPVMNEKAVEYAVRTALALGCRVSQTSIFARKNYFYPDLPKGYQISQYEEPLASDGALEFRIDGEKRRVKIERLHLEEEAGKLVHSKEGDVSWIDYNRAGIPLVEIVSEPGIRSPHEGFLFLRHLRQLLLYLGVSDVRMEEGGLRCDANVSVRPKGDTSLGVKTELKNMNSFRAVEEALLFEIERQTGRIREGEGVNQDTLLWDAERGKAIVMRTKEAEADYRYFPDPDLPPLRIDPRRVETIRAKMPELPWEKEKRFAEEYNLPRYDIEVLLSKPGLADYFEEVLDGYSEPKAASNWVMGEVLSRLKSEEAEPGHLRVTPRHLAEILTLLEDGTISGKIAKTIFQEISESGGSPAEIVRVRGWVQVTDMEEIESAVKIVLKGNPAIVEKYRAGKETALDFLIGRVMRETGGKANPSIVREVIRRKLKSTGS
jgi:aspartyl-tRNA(Asn)/glutamyl-tRNA(Gln) amidotransferase subunit B